MKDAIPNSLKSFVVYTSVSPGYNVCYINEVICHLTTRIKEHLKTDKKSPIFRHLIEDMHII